ncbi:hypothetical protein ACWEQ8_04760, partial [Streptomyces noursei]
GALQGFYGGRTDLVGQRLIEIWSALPDLYLLIIFASIFTPSRNVRTTRSAVSGRRHQAAIGGRAPGMPVSFRIVVLRFAPCRGGRWVVRQGAGRARGGAGRGCARSWSSGRGSGPVRSASTVVAGTALPIVQHPGFQYENEK